MENGVRFIYIIIMNDIDGIQLKTRHNRRRVTDLQRTPVNPVKSVDFKELENTNKRK